ncbi:hypothetical protein METHB2_800012 [Candidatus Methylobacter favarea]|uniref:Uncharacterized protein n=1 Tax=Candidatus Methylobacter favarea TaxID=2707345 RepID=A0A8S0WSI7_9GAMM|nr:hypothetical protein METHB2_800012 [Candidatus Methylobacter favarea]
MPENSHVQFLGGRARVTPSKNTPISVKKEVVNQPYIIEEPAFYPDFYPDRNKLLNWP